MKKKQNNIWNITALQGNWEPISQFYHQRESPSVQQRKLLSWLVFFFFKVSAVNIIILK